MSTIKNGKYGDGERERLASYDHPEYGAKGPDLRPRTTTYTKPQLDNQISNEDAGRWRGAVDNVDY
jgi:hypothetical protein